MNSTFWKYPNVPMYYEHPHYKQKHTATGGTSAAGTNKSRSVPYPACRLAYGGPRWRLKKWPHFFAVSTRLLSASCFAPLVTISGGGNLDLLLGCQHWGLWPDLWYSGATGQFQWRAPTFGASTMVKQHSNVGSMDDAGGVYPTDQCQPQWKRRWGLYSFLLCGSEWKHSTGLSGRAATVSSESFSPWRPSVRRVLIRWWRCDVRIVQQWLSCALGTCCCQVRVYGVSNRSHCLLDL
jgi:hypothetical protein